MHQSSLFAQDNSTVSHLHQRHASLIMISVRRLVPSWEDAEDIVLEVFLAALEQEKRLCCKNADAMVRGCTKRLPRPIGMDELL